jgi:mannonate dehydratase
MKIGLGLYNHLLNRKNYQFARQVGCTHVVAHLVDYFNNNSNHSPDKEKIWSQEMLDGLVSDLREAGLEPGAIENFDPAHWHDILLDGPKKKKQIENIKIMIQRVGKAGIPVIGYYFSLAGVWGQKIGAHARGGAKALGFEASNCEKTPITRGEVWNIVYDHDAPDKAIELVNVEELWQRLQDFLREVVPVAEEAGVRLAAHPDDPPVPMLRGQPRLIYEPDHLSKLLDLAPSDCNALEFCIGTIAEMKGSDTYKLLEEHAQKDTIAYAHFRNIKGTVPSYKEVFVDEGDLDMLRVMRILHHNNYDGVLIPDHTPALSCEAPWHGGMAHAIGYMRAALQMIEKE